VRISDSMDLFLSCLSSVLVNLVINFSLNFLCLAFAAFIGSETL